MTEFCALSHAESARHIAQTPVFGKCSCLLRVTARRLGLADQLGEASLVVDQRQVAQVVAAMLSQVKGEQHRLTATALVPQRMKVQRPVISGDHDLAGRRLRHNQEAVRPVMAVAC